MNVFTVDVEEWTEPLTSRGIDVPPDHKIDLRPEIENIIGLLSEFNHGATFFIVGSYAARHPETVRLIAESGYEIGSHYDEHVRLNLLSDVELKRGIVDSVHRLEDIGGTAVRGFRAPFFSYTEALADILKNLGFAYDSSIVPAFSFLDGRRAAQHGAHRLSNGLVELPLSTFMKIPVSGLAYLKMLPRGLIRRLTPNHYVLYLHPREICDRLPRLSLPMKLKWLLYDRQKQVLPILRMLCKETQFTSVIKHLESEGLVP